MRASVGGSRHKVYLGKWNKWLEFMRKKGRGPWLNLLDKSEVRTLLLEIHGLSTVFILITSSPVKFNHWLTSCKSAELASR